MFDSVLVANRGEIAVRVIRTLRRLGIRAIAVHSDADAGAPHVRAADLAVRLGPTPAAESYLHTERVLEAAGATGAQAIHPGYGFLSENAAFARACAAAGIVFVGPPPEAIEAMGDKIRAKQTVEPAGVPVVPGVHRPGLDDDALTRAAEGVGYPLLVKAAAGGGGKGMRIVRAAGELAEALSAARREARNAFGDDDLLLERYLERPRHIEIQVLADTYGNVVHLGERECSLQRRHQKVIEEAPSPVLDAAMRARMGAAAVGAATSCGYTGAGTVEFIVPFTPAGQTPSEFFFLEMNTRLQVEHPVTELVTGLDLVEQQLRVAAGQPLGFTQDDVTLTGHAVEARVYAEDPARGFLPTGGRILVYAEPSGDGVRVDSGVAAGVEVGSAYDPMLAKVIAHGPDRATALGRLDAALRDFTLLGPTTNTAFLRVLLDHPDVAAGALDTSLAERVADDLPPAGLPHDVLAAAALARLLALEPDGPVVDPFTIPGGWRIGEAAWAVWLLRQEGGDADPVEVRVRGRAARAEVAVADEAPLVASARWEGPHRLLVTAAGQTRAYAYAERSGTALLGRDGATWAIREEDRLEAARHHDAAAGVGPLLAPMPGTVTVVHVEPGETVAAGQTLLVVEAMKMEHPIKAPADGVVAELAVAAGDRVDMDQRLAVVAPDGGEA
ncbi:MAG TPA: biotin carboxylase N-terminal domain-containing protein [Egibacteraceae bacterium]|nr:biotin carboxylase N-terminal domain-containing protein [Egibacteraceae bacterium]